MTLFIVAFLGGVLTIFSPCILPVLPFVFARTEQSFRRGTLPLLAGMALTFALIATLAAVGGAWAVRLNQYGRVLAMVLLALFALTLLSRRMADAMARPFTALGNRLSGSEPGAPAGVGRSLLLGVATGLLWAPCAGPILGLVLTGAAISGPNARTSVLLLAYAAGAASSLAVATLAGGGLFRALKRSLGAGEWIRRVLGVAVLAGVAVIALGWDNVLTRLSLASTSHWEQSLLDRVRGAPPATGTAMQASAAGGALPVEGQMPSLAGATAWLNSAPLTREALRGRVVLVDFWTYSCINCLRSLPYIKGWYDKYKDHGLIIIGVHAPEFPFEKDENNVRRAVHDLGIQYPVALDNDLAIWKAFNNEYWPAHYFIDAMGRIRGHHFGEGDYDGSEQLIRRLLTEAGFHGLPPAGGSSGASGVEMPADESDLQSPETYVGYERADNFASPGGFAQDHAKAYSDKAALALNSWALAGDWTVGADKAVLNRAPGRIVYRFYARDLHLVLGPGTAPAIRFRVLLDGKEPGDNHGVDTDATGRGVIREQRLYQLIRQSGAVGEHIFTLELLDPGAEAYSFTFG